MLHLNAGNPSYGVDMLLICHIGEVTKNGDGLTISNRDGNFGSKFPKFSPSGKQIFWAIFQIFFSNIYEFGHNLFKFSINVFKFRKNRSEYPDFFWSFEISEFWCKPKFSCFLKGKTLTQREDIYPGLACILKPEPAYLSPNWAWLPPARFSAFLSLILTLVMQAFLSRCMGTICLRHPTNPKKNTLLFFSHFPSPFSRHQTYLVKNPKKNMLLNCCCICLYTCQHR